MAVIMVATRVQDDRAVERSVQLTTTALDNEKVERTLVTDAAWAILLDTEGKPADAGHRALVEVTVVDESGRVLYGRPPAGVKPDELVATAATLLARTVAGDSASGLVALGNVPHVVAARRVETDAGSAAGTSAYVISGSALDGPTLARMSERYFLPELRLATQSPDEDWATLPLRDADGGILGNLSWLPDRPGRESQRHLTGVAGLVWMVMIGLVWVYIRRALRLTSEVERGRAARREAEILRRGQRALEESEARYRNLFEESPTSIREEDWSELKKALDDGASDVDSRIQVDSLADRRPTVRVLDVNRAALDIQGTRDKVSCINRMTATANDPASDVLAAIVADLRQGARRTTIEHEDSTVDGRQIIVRKQVQIPTAHVTDWGRVLVTEEDITERRHQQEQIEFLAHNDVLTGLPNRELFRQMLSHAVGTARRAERRLALLYIDIDDFRSINETLDQQTGDTVLQAIADRLRDHMRAGDTLGRDTREALSRLAGDEFTIILSDIDRPDDAASAAERVLQIIAEPLQVESNRIFLTASVGISMFPEDGEEAEGLLRSAGLALNRSKTQKVRKYNFYIPQMDAEVLARKSLEQDLRRAVDQDELWLSYQPLVDAESERIIGVESLVRWTHPERGGVSPAEFIPIAEQTNLIIPIGDWVLRNACAQAKAWQDAGYPSVPVSVNVSVAQILHQDVVATVEQVLAEPNLDPGLLHIEITENILMSNFEAGLAMITELRKRGIEVLLDDFGTGYSSLSYLKRFPINTVKIDQTFVRDIPDDADDVAIVRAIIRMARALNLKVTAEGVENQSQLDLLREEGCDTLQGYRFGQPMPVGEITRHLAERGG
jgi:diguanylate cyclase (GGDEF)-like protein